MLDPKQAEIAGGSARYYFAQYVCCTHLLQHPGSETRSSSPARTPCSDDALPRSRRFCTVSDLKMTCRGLGRTDVERRLGWPGSDGFGPPVVLGGCHFQRARKRLTQKSPVNCTRLTRATSTTITATITVVSNRW